MVANGQSGILENFTMKTLIGIVVAFALVLGLSSPAFANECLEIIQKIEAAMDSAELSDDQRDKISSLIAEGESLHEAGQHDKAVDVLNQAMAMLPQ